MSLVLFSTSVKDVDQDEVVKRIAHFKQTGMVKVPEWSDLVKRGVTEDMAPVNPDWYYIRSPVGVNTFRNIYGSKLRRGVQPNGYAKASESVIRKALKRVD
ncbi:hypothetical protein PRIPAC_79855 [Pristionchus pacificus]|uniref:Ribosomal protein n=1 Tax=Pristionchus pacificus TaxID=54126 RepID=A0A2A6CL81_PRIPA|nr:hypothetical protein PRIPAC_79855 [Pristionchus pacificus]|eukprot:PDM78860.1 ribosomal protein [Pristionchus pacificus]